ncbi:MAG TPA: PIG-L family deacetylase, partial [Flavobacterium sp.]
MYNRFFNSACISVLAIFFTNAQPAKPTSVEVFQQIQKLNFLGSVLYIAAHPDDENTRLISYFSNEVHARTGYLSLTRGDGGQNLVGPELREFLGVIRTQELIEARKIDGGEQFFSRANDFGFSKVPDETLKIWNKEQVLSDVVWTIRKFRPDVIINRFDSRTPGSTHGHHTASAMLSLEGFEKAGKPEAFPEQLNFLKTWQPKRVYFNTSYWFYGGKEKFDKADKTALHNLQIGVFYKSIGKSNQEIAALSRSRHQSQGFGSTGTRGIESEYLELINGQPLKDKNNFFEGIDTSWNRVIGGAAIGTILSNVERSFDFKNPELSIPDLLKAYNLIHQLDDEHWKNLKTEEITKIIAACAGLYLEAVSLAPDSTPGSEINVNVEAINRSGIQITLKSITTFPDNKPVSKNLELLNNIGHTFPVQVQLPPRTNYSQPYWLNEQATNGMYTVNNQLQIGLPDVIRDTKVTFVISIGGTLIPFERNVIYKYNDDVKGEVYEPFDVVPAVTTSIVDKVKIFTTRKSKPVTIKVKAGKDAIKGEVRLEIP